MKRLIVALGFGCSLMATAQEPWIYHKGNNTWVLYRPKRLSAHHVQDLRIGQIRSSVENVKLDGKDCKLYTWHSEIWPHAGGPDAQVDLDTLSWVSPEGKVLKIVARSQKWTTVHEATAIFRGDEVDISTNGPKGKTKTTLFPKGGSALFDNAFKGILKNPDAKPEDAVEYNTLDPITGMPITYHVRVKNRVRGMFDGKEMVGKSIEIKGKSGTIVAYVTTEGDLLQVDFENGTRVYPFSYVPTIKQITMPGFGG